MRPVHLSSVAVVVTAAGLIAGCGQDHTASPVPTSPTVITAEPIAATPRTTGPEWPMRPVTVTHAPAVPPVPVVSGVRYAGHPEAGYDRFVLDVTGGLPGYSVRYADAVVADGSGQPVDVPGHAYLLITLTPAQAHTDAGRVTVTGTHRIGLPMLTAYAVAGDYEGHVTVALGLDRVTGFRVGELSGRIYVDVAR
jgi:hypothetical protein